MARENSIRIVAAGSVLTAAAAAVLSLRGMDSPAYLASVCAACFFLSLSGARAAADGWARLLHPPATKEEIRLLSGAACRLAGGYVPGGAFVAFPNDWLWLAPRRDFLFLAGERGLELRVADAAKPGLEVGFVFERSSARRRLSVALWLAGERVERLRFAGPLRFLASGFAVAVLSIAIGSAASNLLFAGADAALFLCMLSSAAGLSLPLRTAFDPGGSASPLAPFEIPKPSRHEALELCAAFLDAWESRRGAPRSEADRL